MIEAKVTSLEPLRMERVQDLLRTSGPRITILLPPYRPGEQGKPMASLLKSYLQGIGEQLAARRVAEPVTRDLLKPLEELTRDEELLGGSHFCRAIFRSRELFDQFDLLGPVTPQCFVGSYFHVRGILNDLHLPLEFYLLKLSKKDVELLRCAELRAERVSLPKGVPETLDEAMAFEQPDHDLVNRSTAGVSTGDMRGVRFGTGSAREKKRTHLADFYKIVDRGIGELLHGGNAPLVLAGVDEDTAVYRMIHTYPNLLSQSIHGSLSGPAAEQDLLQQAHAIVRTDHTDRTAASLAEWRERLAPTRFARDLNTVLRVSAQGRVDKLYVCETAQKNGILPDGGSSRWEEDLLNVAAVQTILHGGAAFELPQHKMPDGAPVAAVLRY